MAERAPREQMITIALRKRTLTAQSELFWRLNFLLLYATVEFLRISGSIN